jgi:AraC-like DNA-binding protein
MANAVAPIVVEDQLLATLSTEQAMVRDQIDWEWHRRYANEIGIPWQTYQAALERSPHMTLEQMEGIAEMMGMIANNIAHLAHRNQMLENELRKAQSAAGQASHFARETIDRAIDFMQENLEEAISIRDVARQVSLNPCYFSTLFSGQMGCTPSEFLTRLRVERAKEYLRHTTMSVMDICVALDYNPSYFNRLFKKMTGQTPGGYARQARQA